MVLLIFCLAEIGHVQIYIVSNTCT